MRLVLASNNARKLAELGAMLRGIPGDDATPGAGIAVLPQGALGVTEADEPHATFVENALAKARHAAAATGLAAVADDSGLCVAALGGLPGVGSAHFAALDAAALDAAALDTAAPDAAAVAAAQGGREALRRAQDAANNALLLQRMDGVTERDAYFACTLVAVRHAADPEPLIATGRWHGQILAAPRGDRGFGYNPLLWVPSLGCSVAEMDEATKNRHSHRALAMAQLLPLLRTVWGL